jgi:hypothetical protein
LTSNATPAGPARAALTVALNALAGGAAPAGPGGGGSTVTVRGPIVTTPDRTPAQPGTSAAENDACQKIVPGLEAALADVNTCVWESPLPAVVGCARPWSMSGLASSAGEDATAKVTGACEGVENVIGVPAGTLAPSAGSARASITVRFAAMSPLQSAHGNSGGL